jgi:hypothetical protein
MTDMVFELQIRPVQRAQRQYRAHVQTSPVGSASATFNFPMPLNEFDVFRDEAGATVRLLTPNNSPEIEKARSLGKTLYDTVFSGKIAECFERSIDRARRQNVNLRLLINIDEVPELARFPWEYLYSSQPQINGFLALSSKILISRYIELADPRLPLRVQGPLKILVIMANPKDVSSSNRYDEVKEWNRLQTTLEPFEHFGLLTVKRLETPTLFALRQELRQSQYHALHFIGSSVFNKQIGSTMVLLEDDQRRSHPVDSIQLGAIAQSQETLRLIVLASGLGGAEPQQGPLGLAARNVAKQGIPAVIDAQFNIGEEVSTTFLREFYQSLARGSAVDAALVEARTMMQAQRRSLAWGLPTLYLSSQDGQIFELTPLEMDYLKTKVVNDCRFLLSDGQLDLAATKLRALLAFDPHNQEALELEASIQSFKQQRNTQDEMLARLNKLYDQGASLLGEGRTREALKKFEQIRGLGVTFKDTDQRIAAAQQKLHRSTRVKWSLGLGLALALIVGGLYSSGMFKPRSKPVTFSSAGSSNSSPPTAEPASAKNNSGAVYEPEVRRAIEQAANAEIKAFQTLDAEPLYTIYADAALQNRLSMLNELKQFNQEFIQQNGFSFYSDNVLENRQYNQIAINDDGSRAEVDMTETWHINMRDVGTHSCLQQIPSHVLRQTVYLEYRDGHFVIYRFEFDPNNAPVLDPVKC